jgi:hypothetical protein
MPLRRTWQGFFMPSSEIGEKYFRGSHGFQKFTLKEVLHDLTAAQKRLRIENFTELRSQLEANLKHNFGDILMDDDISCFSLTSTRVSERQLALMFQQGRDKQSVRKSNNQHFFTYAF